MRIEYFLIIIYIVFIFWLLPKISFIKHAQLTSLETRLLLAFKIFSGIVCAFYLQNASSSVDYLEYNTEGIAQYKLLLSDPKLFFTDLTSDINAYGFGGLFESKYSFWAYLRFNLLFKFIAILNLLTHGNFYFNTVIFCSLVFFGHIAFYRIYSEIYKGQKLKILFAIFCLPSLLLYTSCIHKDGIVFMGIGLTSYAFYKISVSRRFANIRYGVLLSGGLAVLFLFRNYIIMAIVPAMITALFCKWLPFKKRFVLLFTYTFFFVVFFLSGFSKSFLNLPVAVVNRKADFIAMGDANTNIPMNELLPTVKSFLLNLPQAINHYLFRPYLWEFRQLSVMLTAVELFFYQLLLVAFIFYRKKTRSPVDNFNLFGLAFIFNMMLIIGYTIPNIGAIVRYRSIFWVFLISPLMCNIDWNRFPFFRKVANTV